MAPAHGSDAERLIAQIEAFLRTGEAPPAAPEPVPIPHPMGPRASPRPARGEGRPPTRPFDSGALDPLAGGSSGRDHPFRRRLPRDVLARVGLSRVLSRRARQRAPAGPGPAVPRWTPTRVVGVLAFLVALVVLPVVWSSRVTGTNPDGPDHASAAPAGPGYTFLRVNRSGTPVRWDPCTAIFYQLDMTAAPAWAQADLASAIATISRATDIEFVYDGPTVRFPVSSGAGAGAGAGSAGSAGAGSSAAAVAPGSAASPSLPAAVGTAQSPVVIAWATPAETHQLGLATDLSALSAPGTSVETLARAQPVVAADEVTGHMVYVTGTVVFGSAAGALPPGSGPGSDGLLMLHEIARLVGLGDTDTLGQVMSPYALTTGVTGLGSGDRAGLARLGHRSGCLQVPPGATLEPVF